MGSSGPSAAIGIALCALACMPFACSAPSEPPRAASSSITLAPGVHDVDADTVIVCAEGFGATEALARQQALHQARAEAAATRRTHVRAVAQDELDTQRGDRFRSVTRLDAEATVAGARTGRVQTARTEGDEFRALAELLVPSEQIFPGKVLASLAAGSPSPRSHIEAFIVRATNRGDLDAAAMGWRTLLYTARRPDADPRPDDVLALASLEERNGQLFLAVNTLDTWIRRSTSPDPRWLRMRDELATRLPDPDEVLERPLRAARTQPHAGLALRVDRQTASWNQAVRLRGQVPPGQDLVLFWLDGEQLAFLWAQHGVELAGGHVDQDYVVDDPAGFVPGPVTLLALSGPGLATLAGKDLEVDLAACRRGDLSQLQQLQDASDAICQWIKADAVQAQVLSWEQVEETP
ncbi:MAG: hypothetical protein DRQ55_05960 [Planctomycetota bacterium]|nr:MAG: hypothetical protein DRQ55_05960 [Planctomycetota bacterium]